MPRTPADEAADDHADQPQHQGVARAVEDAAEDVAAGVVGAEPVLGARWTASPGEVGEVGIVGRHQGANNAASTIAVASSPASVPRPIARQPAAPGRRRTRRCRAPVEGLAREPRRSSLRCPSDRDRRRARRPGDDRQEAMARIMIAPCAVGNRWRRWRRPRAGRRPGHENMVSVTTAPPQERRLQPDQGDDGDHRVAQRVMDDHDPLAQSLGARRAHEIGAEYSSSTAVRVRRAIGPISTAPSVSAGGSGSAIRRPTPVRCGR